MSILKKSASFLLSAVICTGALSLCASAEKHIIDNTPVDISLSYIYDEADMLTDEEEAALTEELRATAEYIDMNILIQVSGTRIYSKYDTFMYAEKLCLDNYGFYGDSVVLYLDLSGHNNPNYSPYDYLYTRNRARFYFSGETDGATRTSEIFSEMNPYLPRVDADVESALYEFLESLRYYYDRGPDEAVGYFYVSDLDEYVMLDSAGNLIYTDERPINWGFAAVVGIVAGLIAAIIAFIAIKLHYRFKSKPSSLQYTSFDRVQYGVPTDMFIRKYRTKTRIQSSSGGGGGSGGGSSSGGGGGGNHR